MHRLLIFLVTGVGIVSGSVFLRVAPTGPYNSVVVSGGLRASIQLALDEYVNITGPTPDVVAGMDVITFKKS